MGKSSKKKFQAAAGTNNKSTSNKREAVLGSPKKGGGKGTIIGLGIAIAVLAVIAFVIFGGGSGSSSFTVVKAEAGVVKIPIATVNDGKARFYTYNGSKPINFFVIKSSDGVFRAAFDACDVCYPEKKGYHQEGDVMVCNNCGQRFPSVKVNEIRGGCNPAPLERTAQGDYLLLKTSDIESGSSYF